MIRFASLLFCLIMLQFAYAQTSPGRISYQAVVRDPQGNELVDQFVTVDFNIHRGSPDGEVVFSESHSLVPTNQFGLFSTTIGTGVTTGDGLYAALSEVPWETDDYFLEVSAGQPGNPTQVVGISQLLSVPYSYYSAKAGSVINESDGDVSNELIDEMSINGTVLSIVEQGIDFQVDLGQALAAGSSNAIISNASLDSAFELTISEGTNASSVDMSPVAYATWNENPQAVYTEGQAVGINTSNPQSTLEVNGSLAVRVAKLDAGSTNLNANSDLANRTVFVCDVGLGDVNVQLVPAASCNGRIYKFRKFFLGAITANDVVITPFAGDQIDGQISLIMSSSQAEYLTLVSDGEDWYVIDHHHE